MGTNYYARYSPCPYCHRCSAEKHIGKSSAGWKFLFQSYDDIYSFKDWQKELNKPGVQVWNEYNEEIMAGKLIVEILEKQLDPKNLDHSFDSSNWVDSDGFNFTNKDFS